MTAVRWDVGWGALLVLSLAYFFDDTGLFAACVPAVLAHEAGHIAALRYFGANLRKVSIKIYGAKIDYSGILGVKQRAISLAAGPAFGALYSILAYLFFGTFGKLSAMASAVMTVFNALPILPLDGGGVVECVAGKNCAERISLIASAMLCALAIVVLFACSSVPLLFVAVGLFTYSLLAYIN